jgi:hypothetical protein
MAGQAMDTHSGHGDVPMPSTREAAGVDRFGRIAADLADGGDPRVLHYDIGAAWLPSEAVDNRGPTDQQIVHRGVPPAVTTRRS